MGRRFLEQNTTQSTLSGSGSKQMNPLGEQGAGQDAALCKALL